MIVMGDQCTIFDVTVEYSPLGYFSTSRISPSAFKIAGDNFVYITMANSISIEENDNHTDIYFELDGRTMECIEFHKIRRIYVKKLTLDDLRQVRRTLRDFFEG